MSKLVKRPDPDGTFALLDGSGNPVAIGLPEGDADARIASEAGKTGPADGSPAGPEDKAGAKDGGRKAGKG